MRDVAARGAFHISYKVYDSLLVETFGSRRRGSGLARFPPKMETVPVKYRGGWLWRKRRPSDVVEVAGSGQARFPYAMFTRFRAKAAFKLQLK